jgi:WD40 repeat protein
LAASCDDCLIRLWDLETGRVQRTLGSEHFLFVAIAYVREGDRLVAAQAGRPGGAIRIWDVKNARELAAMRLHDGSLEGMALAPNGALVATGETGGRKQKTIRLWDLTEQRLKVSFSGHENAVFGAGFSPDGRYLATAGSDSTLLVWDIGQVAKGAG